MYEVVCVADSMNECVSYGSVSGDSMKAVEAFVGPGAQKRQWCVLQCKEDDEEEICNREPGRQKGGDGDMKV